jgi:hypothetical protein
MKNYKINIDKPKPTQEEILAGRNFDQVLKQYNASPGKVIKKPFWQSAGFIGSVAAVAATVAIVLMAVKGGNPVTDAPQGPVIVDGNNSNSNADDKTPQNTTAWAPTKREIAPPLADLNVPFTAYKVNAKSGGAITHETGTKITFKPNSFVDEAGAPVTGNVEVKYREMHDAVDFFLAGIPMEYDSAGATYVLESAGMMEIAAFVGGKVVYLDKSKPMQVEMASAQSGTGYNLYAFNTDAGNWEYLGKDKVAAMPYAKNQRALDSLAALEKWKALQKNGNGYCSGVKKGKPVDAIRPQKADPTKNRFIVDFNKKEFPEMATYENVIFEVDESKEKFDRANYNVTWESVVLSRGTEAKKYALTLRKGLKTVKLDVYPVLDGQEYATVAANYEKAHAEYLKDSTEYAEFARGGYTVTPVDANAPNQAFVFDAVAARSAALEYEVQRSFELSGFGVFNTDRASNLPQGAAVELALTLPGNLAFTGATYAHVDRQKNSVMNYHNGGTFFCNTLSENLIWAVQDGELYYAENESFTALPFVGKAGITLKKVAKKLKSAEEMRMFFRLKAPVNA